MISILYFRASWCGPCKMFAPILTEVVNTLGTIPLITVDVDEKPEMALQHNVSSVPTTIVVCDGVEVFRQSGMIGKVALTETLSKFTGKQILNG